jgi:hypothetical protein
MNNPEHNVGRVEDRLRGYRVVVPSPELKERVLGAARDAWRAAPADDIPWIVPILRLAACLIAAVLPVFWVHTTASIDVARFAVVERDSPAARETVGLWAMTGRSQFAGLHLRAAATPDTNAADLLARHLRALAAELPEHRTNGG